MIDGVTLSSRISETNDVQEKRRVRKRGSREEEEGAREIFPARRRRYSFFLSSQTKIRYQRGLSIRLNRNIETFSFQEEVYINVS